MPGSPVPFDDDVRTAVRIAHAACAGSARLDEARSTLYVDLMMNSLGAAARQAFQSMQIKNYQYQSEFARHYHSQGIRDGRAALISRQLKMRFGSLAPEATSRIAEATIDELDAIGERLLTAETLQDALGPR